MVWQVLLCSDKDKLEGYGRIIPRYLNSGFTKVGHHFKLSKRVKVKLSRNFENSEN